MRWVPHARNLRRFKRYSRRLLVTKTPSGQFDDTRNNPDRGRTHMSVCARRSQLSQGGGRAIGRWGMLNSWETRDNVSVGLFRVRACVRVRSPAPNLFHTVEIGRS